VNPECPILFWLNSGTPLLVEGPVLTGRHHYVFPINVRFGGVLKDIITKTRKTESTKKLQTLFVSSYFRAFVINSFFLIPRFKALE